MNEWWAVLKNDEHGISEYGGPLCDDCKAMNPTGFRNNCSGSGCYELSGGMPQSEHWQYAGVEPQWTQDWGAIEQEWKDAARKQWPSERAADFDEQNAGDDVSVEDLYGNPVIIPSLGRPITEEEEREYNDWQKHGHHLEWAEEQRGEQEAAQAKQEAWDALMAEAEEAGISVDPWTEKQQDHDALRERIDAVNAPNQARQRENSRRRDTNRRGRTFRRGEPMDMAWRLLKHA